MTEGFRGGQGPTKGPAGRPFQKHKKRDFGETRAGPNLRKVSVRRVNIVGAKRRPTWGGGTWSAE